MRRKRSSKEWAAIHSKTNSRSSGILKEYFQTETGIWCKKSETKRKTIPKLKYTTLRPVQNSQSIFEKLKPNTIEANYDPLHVVPTVKFTWNLK